MLFQAEQTLLFILWLIVATVIVALILYIAVLLIESKTKASDKKFLIILLAFICVLIIPIVLGAINQVLGTIGSLIAFSGSNYLTNLTPIIGFLIILILVKFFIDISWDHAVWISLLTLFLLFLLYTMIPELYNFLGFGL
ncbi:MAG: hypothetical protein EU542_00540 [Promethearchaeota archaeon]|jgi:hypothetical protein|nr:MAG: hypothetical protein EU542_00540 [Candidatus Lokiarchaeota archaeon]